MFNISKHFMKIVIGCLSIIIIFISLIIWDSNKDKITTSPKEAADQIISNSEQLEEINQDLEEESHSEEKDIVKSIQQQNDEPHEAGEFLVGALYLDDLDLFSQAFHPQKFMDTLLLYGPEERQSELESIVNVLTNENSISGANVSVVKSKFGTSTDEIDIHIFYEDGSKIELLSIPTVPVHTEHHSKRVAIYALNISPHELIEKIGE